MAFVHFLFYGKRRYENTRSRISLICKTMLDMVMELMPSPLDVEDIQGTKPDTEESVIRKPSYDEPFSALAFKIATSDLHHLY